MNDPLPDFDLGAMASSVMLVIQKSYCVWILTAISLERVHARLNLGLSVGGDNCQKFAVKASPSSCSDKDTTINAMLTLESLPARNSAICISKCYLDYNCALAVFASPICLLMSSNNGTKSSLPLSLDQEDCKAFTILSVRCVNGGTPHRYTCSCPDQFAGPSCELTKEPRCQARAMTAVDPDDYVDLARLEVPMKTGLYMADGGYIVYRIGQCYHSQWTGYLTLPEPSLSVAFQDADFADPPGMDFTLFRGSPDKEIKVLLLDGAEYPGGNPNTANTKHTFYTVHAYIDDNRVFYNNSGSGSGDPRAIVEGLSRGHRLMYRTPVTVAFDPNSQSDVYVSIISSPAKHDGNFFDQPMDFSTSIYEMSTGLKHSVSYTFGQGAYGNATTESRRRWELDDCWDEATPPGGTGIMDVLKEAVLSGQEIRVVQDDFLSSDVIQVTLTPNDLVVEVAPYFYPPDNPELLSVDSVVLHSAFSPNKALARCERRIGQATDSSYKYFPNSGSNYRWFISKRTWTLLFKIYQNGSITEGSSYDLNSKVMTMYDMRVCIEFDDQQTMCVADGKVRSRGYVEVLFQTRPFIKPSFNADGFFQGFLDPLCSSHEYFISSTGWMKGVSYVIGNTTASYDKDVSFKSLSWFANYYP